MTHPSNYRHCASDSDSMAFRETKRKCDCSSHTAHDFTCNQSYRIDASNIWTWLHPQFNQLSMNNNCRRCYYFSSLFQNEKDLFLCVRALNTYLLTSLPWPISCFFLITLDQCNTLSFSFHLIYCICISYVNPKSTHTPKQIILKRLRRRKTIGIVVRLTFSKIPEPEIYLQKQHSKPAGFLSNNGSHYFSINFSNSRPTS